MELKKILDEDGYCFMPSYMVEMSTIDIAKNLGEIFDVSLIDGFNRVPVVQVLKPKVISSSIKNTYSSYFGLSNFPFHTDLSYFKFPPRYLLLRCLVGDESVSTNVLDLNGVMDRYNFFKDFYFKYREFGSGVFSMGFGSGYVKYDPVFMIPLNERSKKIRSIFDELEGFHKNFFLNSFGDTLIIDNWRVLHGRSEVVDFLSNRAIERVYLNSIY